MKELVLTESILSIRRACRRARSVLDAVLSCDRLIRPGVTTDEIDDAVFRLITDPEVHTEAGPSYPSPLNYAGFPKSVCTSINEVVCHGIPDSRPLEHGDILSVDISLFTNDGVHGDNCGTVMVVGEEFRNNEDADENDDLKQGRRLIKAAYECLMAGVDACKPGACLSEVGAAVQSVSDSYGYGSVRKYCGHGIGSEFHCPPFVKVRAYPSH